MINQPILLKREHGQWEHATLLDFGIDCEENRADNVMHFSVAICRYVDGTCGLEQIVNIKFV